jgi:hypothetical protein
MLRLMQLLLLTLMNTNSTFQPSSNSLLRIANTSHLFITTTGISIVFRIILGNGDISHALIPLLVDSDSVHQPRNFPDCPVIFVAARQLPRIADPITLLLTAAWWWQPPPPKESAVRNDHHAADI